MGMDEESADTNAFEWLFTQPKVNDAAYAISRLKNDIMGHKVLIFIVIFYKYLKYVYETIVYIVVVGRNKKACIVWRGMFA